MRIGKPTILRIAAYIVVAMAVYLCIGSIVYAVRGDDVLLRVGAGCAALAFLVLARYVSARVWPKGVTSK